MAISRDEIIVRAGFDNTALASGLRSTQQTVGEWASKIGTMLAGAFAVGKISEFEKSVLELAKNISLTAERLDVTTDEVQKLEYAGKMTGVELDTIATALDKLARAKEKILHGDAGADKLQEAFGRFGMTIKDIEALTPDELFNRISESVSKTGANAEVTYDAMELFGKSAGRLIPLLAEFEKFRNEAPIITPEELANIRKAGVEWEMLGSKLEVIGARITSSFVYVYKALTTGKGIFAWQKPLEENLIKPLSQTVLPGESEGGEGSGMPGKAGGGTPKAGTADLYRRRAELARKVLQVSRHPQAESKKMFDELRTINDELDIKNAPNEEGRLKVERDQAARDLRTEQNKLLPTEAGRAFQKEKIYSLTDKVKGFDFQIGDLHKTALERLSAHAANQTLSMAKIAGAIDGSQMKVVIASD